MSSSIVRTVSAQAALACVAIVVLAACQRGAETAAPDAQLAWARAALERNPQIEVVATDTQAGVFTIRDRQTGDVQAVRADELAAAPISRLQAQAATPAAAPQSPTAPRPADEVAASTSAEPAPPAEPVQPAAAARAEPAVANATNPGYTIERADGQLRVTGPGISVVSSGPATTQRAAAQATVDPIICEGRRMVHLDNRTLHVDGDAIIARGGCELYITNSRISASGTGIVVQDATVHVSNSHIEGARGSFDADDRARLFVRSSTFTGIPKRTQLAMVQDQGGNRWQ